MKKMLLMFACFLLISMAFAQNQTAAKVDTLSQKVDKMEKVLKHLPKISGYIQLGYNADFGEDIATDPTDFSNTFQIRRARLKLNGDIFTPKIDYCLQVEFASPKIVDAYVRFKPFHQLNIQVGQFKTPFTIENTEYNPKTIEMISSSFAVNNLVEQYRGTGTTGRNLGINLYGSFWKREGYSILSYDLGIYNGNGINLKDDNNFKTIVGRVRISPIRHLTLSGSALYGGMDEIEDPTGDITLTQKNPYLRYSAGVNYDKPKGLLVRSEYVGGGTQGVNSQGVYALAGYHITKAWTCVARYDWYQSNTTIKESQNTRYGLGVVYQPFKYLRAQLYYYNQVNHDYSKNSNHIALMLTGMF